LLFNNTEIIAQDDTNSYTLRDFKTNLKDFEGTRQELRNQQITTIDGVDVFSETELDIREFSHILKQPGYATNIHLFFIDGFLINERTFSIDAREKVIYME
jgi:hypothetical protein